MAESIFTFFRNRLAPAATASPAAPAHPLTLKTGPRVGNGKVNPARHRRFWFNPARAHHGRTVTVEGTVFVILTILIGLAAVNSGTNLLYLFLSMMMTVLLVSGLIAFENIHGVRIERKAPREVHAGQGIDIQYEIINRKWFFFSYGLRIHEEIEGPRELRLPLQAFQMTCPARARVTTRAHAVPLARGWYSLGLIRVVSRFPAGFIESYFTLQREDQILVYPRLLRAESVLSLCALAAGVKPAERKGHSSGLFGIRDYQQGDSVRMIHWKHSARGMGVKVKEMDDEQPRHFCLMLDTRLPASAPPARLGEFEKAISVTATLARLLLRQGATVALWTSAGKVPPGTGSGQLRRIFRTLAIIEPQAPGVRLPSPDPVQGEVTRIWIEHQDTGARSGGATARQTDHLIIDARQVPDVYESNPCGSLPET